MKIDLSVNMGPPDVLGQVFHSKLTGCVSWSVFIFAFLRIKGITNLLSMYSNPSDS